MTTGGTTRQTALTVSGNGQPPALTLQGQTRLTPEQPATTLTASTTATSASFKWSTGATTPSISTTLTGPYSVTLTAGECTNVVSATITGSIVPLGPGIRWQKTFGGSGDEFGGRLAAAPGGGYFLWGGTNSTDGDVSDFLGFDSDGWVAKLNTDGTLVWQRCLGGYGGYDFINAVAPLSDGGCFAVGSTSSINLISGRDMGDEALIVRLNAKGEVVWQKVLGSTNPAYNGATDMAVGVIATPDGGGIFAGSKNGTSFRSLTDNRSAWLVKFSSSGDVQWEREYRVNKPTWATAIQATPDGGYSIAGNIFQGEFGPWPTRYNIDGWVAKLSADGAVQWQTVLGGQEQDELADLKRTSDGGYIVTGTTSSPTSGPISYESRASDAWLVKMSATGSVQWQRRFGGMGWDGANSVALTSDGGYVLTGSTDSDDGDATGYRGDFGDDAWVLKVDATGRSQWQRTFGGTKDDEAYSVLLLADGGFLISAGSQSKDGDRTESRGYYDMWLFKIGGTASSGRQAAPADVASGVRAYPSPARERLTVECSELSVEPLRLRLLTIEGRVALETVLPAHQTQTDVAVGHLPRGLYWLQASSPAQTHGQRVLLH